VWSHRAQRYADLLAHYLLVGLNCQAGVEAISYAELYGYYADSVLTSS